MSLKIEEKQGRTYLVLQNVASNVAIGSLGKSPRQGDRVLVKVQDLQKTGLFRDWRNKD